MRENETFPGGSPPENIASQNFESTYLGVIVIIHTLIILLAILGNSIVIYLVVTNFKLRNVRNAFMLNLTLSNLLLATVCTPWFLITLVNPDLAVSEIGCKLFNSIPIVIILVSAFSIMMISIDRWMFVVFARSRQFKRKEATISIVLIWIFAILLAAPTFYNRQVNDQIADSLRQKLIDAINRSKIYSQAFTLSLNSTEIDDISSREHNNSIDSVKNKALEELMDFSFNFGNINIQRNKKYCVENWTDLSHKRIYILILFGLEFVLPCLCMLVTYIWIIRFLKVQNDRMSHYEMLRKKLIQKERPHQKNCKLLSSLCLTFIVCCLPLSLFNIISDFISTSEKQTVIYWPLTILTTLELMNTVLSPLLYGWMNHNFRIEINGKYRKLKLKCQKVKKHEEIATNQIKIPLKCYSDH